MAEIRQFFVLAWDRIRGSNRYANWRSGWNQCLTTGEMMNYEAVAKIIVDLAMNINPEGEVEPFEIIKPLIGSCLSEEEASNVLRCLGF